MTILQDEKQAFVRPILLTGMPAHGARLGGIVSIHLDRHALMQEGFVGDVSVQVSVTPFGLARIRVALLLGRFLAMLAFGALADIGQVFQSNQSVGVLVYDAFTHDMGTVWLPPSLAPADLTQYPGSRSSAFVSQK